MHLEDIFQDSRLPARKDRNYVFAVLFLVSLSAALYLPAFFLTVRFQRDSYCFLSLAKQIPHLSYQLTHYRHLKFLPVYPVIILWFRILSFGGLDYIYSAKLASMLSLISISLLTFDFILFTMRKYYLALLAGALSAFSPIFILDSGSILTEPIFSFLAFATFVLIARKRNYLAWFFAALAVLTRYEGFFLLPALLISQRQELKRLMAGIFIFLVVYSGWAWFILSHLNQFIAFSYPLELFIQKHPGAYYFRDILVYASPLVALMGTVGIFLWFRPQRIGALVFAAGFIVTHAYWHFQAARFVMPLVPFFTVGAICAVEAVYRKTERLAVPVKRVALASAIALLILSDIVFGCNSFARLEEFRRDVKKDAIVRLHDYDPSAVVLTNIEPHLAEWWGIEKTYAWDEPGLKVDPYAWAARQYVEHNARYLIWSLSDNFAILWFKDLGQGVNVSKTIQYTGKSFILTFDPIFFLDHGDMIVFFLELKPAP